MHFLLCDSLQNLLPNFFQNKHKKVCLNKNSCSGPKLDLHEQRNLVFLNACWLFTKTFIFKIDA